MTTSGQHLGFDRSSPSRAAPAESVPLNRDLSSESTSGIAPLSSRRAGEMGAKRHGGSFQISSLLLTFVLIAVCLGVGRLSPGAGWLLSLVFVPAFLRTVFMLHFLSRGGMTVSSPQKLRMFLDSCSVCLVTFLTATATLVVILMSCLLLTAWLAKAIGSDYDLLAVGTILGVVLGVGVGGWLAIGVSREAWRIEAASVAAGCGGSKVLLGRDRET